MLDHVVISEEIIFCSVQHTPCIVYFVVIINLSPSSIFSKSQKSVTVMPNNRSYCRQKFSTDLTYNRRGTGQLLMNVFDCLPDILSLACDILINILLCVCKII